MQMRIFLPPTASAGSAANTSCWRNDGPHKGIVPTDTRASPPRFKKARRERFITGLLALVTLEFRRTDDERGEFGGIHRAGRARIVDGYVLLQCGPCWRGQLTFQDRLVQSVENDVRFVDVRAANQVRWSNRNVHDLVLRQRERKVHSRNQCTRADPFARIL